LKPIDVVTTLVGPYMYDVKAFVAREALQHLGAQGVHVGRSDGPFPGLAKEAAKLWVVRLSHLLIEG
jgi:hypothetical protein